MGGGAHHPEFPELETVSVRFPVLPIGKRNPDLASSTAVW
jgi:hypothetical protein